MHLALASTPPTPTSPPSRSPPTSSPRWPAGSRRRCARAWPRSRTGSDPARGRPGPTPRRSPAGPGSSSWSGRSPSGGGLIKIRCHGDYHLGQLLWREGDFSSSTSRGSRAGPSASGGPSIRRSRTWRRCSGRSTTRPTAPWTRRPRSTTTPSSGSNPGPRSGRPGCRPSSSRPTAGSPPPPARRPGRGRQLLDLLRLEKALFELRYEMDYRPDWVRLPIRGVLSLSRSGGA